MERLIFILLSAALSLIRSSEDHPTATTYYVKLGGGTGSGLDDANAWSYAKLNATALSAGDKVVFKRGDTFYGALTARAGVTYDAYGTGAAPVISGFTSVTSWTNLGSNIWSASVSAGSYEPMVLVNGVQVEPGRYPNSGWLTMSVPDTLPGVYPPVKIGNASRMYYPSTGITGYLGGNIVVKKREWIIEKGPTQLIRGDSITFTNPTGFPLLDGWGFYFTDHLATLDQQNEYYYASSTLKMYSTSNPSGLNVKAATVAELVSLPSTHNNCVFQNLTFEGTTGNLFSISGTTNDTIRNCTLRYAGERAIDADFATGLAVIGCNISYTNYSAVDAILGNDQYIYRDTIHHIALQKSLCQPNNKANHGVWVNGTDNVIKNNEISYTGYVGIDFSGNYDTVSYNYVHDHCQTSADGGGIYMSDETNGLGRFVDHNVVTYGLGPRDGTPYSGYDNAMGLYFDESTAGVTITNNYSLYNNGGGIYLHKAHDCKITYNTFYGNTLRQVYAAEDGTGDTRITNITFTNNIVYSLSASDYNYFLYSSGGGPTNFFYKIDNNIVSRPSDNTDIIGVSVDFNTPTEYSLTTWTSTYNAYDQRSTGEPSEFSSGTPTVYINGSGSPLPVKLSAIYKSLKGTTYSIGDIVIPPYTAEVLIQTGTLPTFTTQTVQARGRYAVR